MAAQLSSRVPTRPLNRATLRRARPRYRAARAFYLTLFLFTCFATYALFTHSYRLPARSPAHTHISARGPNNPITPFDSDEHCRRVHQAEDQCAFVHKHCPTDEGGFSLYLDLYFCRLAHAKPVAALVLVSWLALLFSTIGIAASDFFCIDLSTIASILGMSESVAGVTFLAFGNGSPDVFSTFAAMSTNSGSLALGELFGAAGFITAVVAGAMALIRPFKVSKRSFVRDVSFFIVAAAFSLVFLWDGKLRFWECVSMVGFYIFYVVFILVWHWWLERRRRRREREAIMRGHFVPPDDELDLENEEYHDDPDQGTRSRGSSIFPRSFSREDWSALDRASDVSYGEGGSDDGNDDDDEEEFRDRWMNEVATQMRLTRPELGPRSRKNTITPVRPSLVGALEFQAVLKTLQKSRNIQADPLMLRRFSDGPASMSAQDAGRLSTAISDSAIWSDGERRASIHVGPSAERSGGLNVPTPPAATPGRARAVSANDAISLRVDPAFRRPGGLQFQTDLVNIVDEDAVSQHSTSLTIPLGNSSIPQSSPTVHIEPPSPLPDAPIHAYNSSIPTSPNLLALPDARSPFRPSYDQSSTPRSTKQNGRLSQESSGLSPKSLGIPQILEPEEEDLQMSTPHLSPTTRYSKSPVNTRPPSLYLPGPFPSSDAISTLRAGNADASNKPSKWWPYSILPPPGIIVSALFPTIYHWRQKSWWEKCLGLVAMPSVFLLTITLPVVEGDGDTVADEPPSRNYSSAEPIRSKSFDGMAVDLEIGRDNTRSGNNTKIPDIAISGTAGHGSTATVAAHAEEQTHSHEGLLSHQSSSLLGSSADHDPLSNANNGQPQLWNRWLTIIQLFLAPILVVLSVYVQSPVDLSPSWLVMPILLCLLISTILLIPLLCTTTPTYRPRFYRIILSFVGFVVSIAWISSIASQVVDALKALAVILDMSHAIMGLTIFAVGNSLGDLVADVTVAKLGYPIMAFSACLGGPMLNILLGIGLSGSYILLRGAEERHAKHPEKGIRFKVYHIEVSQTLIVSGATLLVTLVGLLVVVPLNRWVFSRRIGWALIALWTLSTIGNVVIEVTGWPAWTRSLAHS